MHLNTFSFWRGPRWWCVLGILDAASASQHRILLQRATMSGRSMLQAAFGKDPPNRHSHYIVVVVVFFVPKTISNDCFFFFFFFFFPLCCWPTSRRRRLFTHTGKGTRENTVDDFRRQLQSRKMGLGQLPTAGRINSIGGFFLLFFQTCRTKWKVLKKLQIDSIRMWNKSNLARLKTFAKTRKRYEKHLDWRSFASFGDFYTFILPPDAFKTE